MALDDILIDLPDTNILHKCIQTHRLRLVADVKQDEYYKWNEELVISWLKSKVNNITKGLQENKMQVTARIASYSDQLPDVDKEEYERYACGILCDYLQEELATKLKDVYGVVDVKPTTKKHAADDKLEKEGGSKHPRLGEPTEDYSNHFKNKKDNKGSAQSTTSKKLQQAAKGTKSISSFFTKKK